MEIVNKKVIDLIPYINNSRTHNEEQVKQICASINEFGFTNPLLIDEKDNIIAGHGRLLASKKLNMEEVPCIVLSGLTEAQKKAYIIADNKLALNAGWDDELLKLELENLKELDFDISLTGFNIDELDDVLGEEKEVEEDDFDVPVGGIETDIVLGDLFEIGEHRLLCGDSTDSDSVAKLMNGEKADMVFTDPPYNINVNSITFNTKIENDNLNENEFKEFIQSVISNIFLFCKGSKYICFDIREKSFINIFYENGMKSLIVWVKDIGQHHRENYGVKYELIAYFEDGAFYGENEENVWECKSIQSAGSRDDSGNLWFNGGSKGLTLHPTQKPILIPTRAINNSSKINDLVLDLFLGSGSTMVAAHQLKRKCYGMELDPKYCQVIIDRMIKLNPSIKITKNGKELNSNNLSN